MDSSSIGRKNTHGLGDVYCAASANRQHRACVMGLACCKRPLNRMGARVGLDVCKHSRLYTRRRQQGLNLSIEFAAN